MYVYTKIEPAAKAAIVIDICRFKSLLKLCKVFAWIYRFHNNLKTETSKRNICLKPFLSLRLRNICRIILDKSNSKPI